jgi:hypothetical protein
MHSFLLLAGGTVLRRLHRHAQLLQPLDHVLRSACDALQLPHVVFYFLRLLLDEVRFGNFILCESRIHIVVTSCLFSHRRYLTVLLYKERLTLMLDCSRR